ncbi:hypothetical protein EBR96_04295 [bacterium]|nr:hypothetical protein [bacterium]
MSQWFTASGASTSQPKGELADFWEGLGVNVMQQPIVAILGDGSSNRSGKKHVLFLTSDQFSIIQLTTTASATWKLEYAPQYNAFVINGKTAAPDALARWVDHAIGLIGESLVVWLGIQTRKVSSQGKNLFWERIADQLSVHLKLTKKIDLCALRGGRSQDYTLGVLEGLRRLSEVVRLSMHDKWEALQDRPDPLDLLKGNVDISAFNSSKIIGELFSKELIGVLESDTLKVRNLDIPIDFAFDYHIEATNDSRIARIAAAIELYLFGVSTKKAGGMDERAVPWGKRWKGSVEFGALIRAAVDGFSSQFTLEKVSRLNCQIKSLPVLLLPVASPEHRAAALNELIALDIFVKKALGFVEWNSHVLPEAKLFRDQFTEARVYLESVIKSTTHLIESDRDRVSEIKITRDWIMDRLAAITHEVTRSTSLEALDIVKAAIAQLEPVN